MVAWIDDVVAAIDLVGAENDFINTRKLTDFYQGLIVEYAATLQLELVRYCCRPSRSTT